LDALVFCHVFFVAPLLSIAMLTVGSVSRNVSEAFFARLPVGKLSNKEGTLLDLLQQVAAVVEVLLPPGVSLQEWAERRVPENSIVEANASRMVYVPDRVMESPKASSTETLPWRASKQAAPAADPAPWQTSKTKAYTSENHCNEANAKANADLQFADADAFFNTLPPDTFLPWEEQLYISLERVLHRKSRSTLSKIAEHPLNAPLLTEHLPKSVTLEDWILRRVGAEFGVVLDANNEKTVTRRDAHTNLRNPKAPGSEQGTEDFFKSLPEASFSSEESALRDAVLRFLEDWPKQSSSKLGPAKSIDLGADERVRIAKVSFLPPNISLTTWCKRRIGGEVELLWLGSSGYAIGLPGDLNRVDAEELGSSQHAKKRKSETARTTRYFGAQA
jgi:hypothetical protein